MHLNVLACDLDGTLAEHGEVAAETWEVLRRARLAGLVIILVTGRTLANLPDHDLFAELCEAIVSENGAAIYFPRRDAVELPFGRLSPMLLKSLQAIEIPLERGMAIAATHVPYDREILKVLHYAGGGATVEYNRGAVMVLPPGATKGTGLRYALHELGYSPHNVVACGDAENDQSLFAVSELAVAVANATPALQALADVVLSLPDGAGVRMFVTALLAGRIPDRKVRLDRRLLLGYRADGKPMHLDPFALVEGNLGIFGASLSGKSWLAGLLAEKILKQGYQVCIIDPEGDYRGLRAFPHSLVLGGVSAQLPPVVDVVTFVEYGGLSLVLDLSMDGTEERTAYVTDLVRALRALRAQRGQPHWFLIDELQHFCPSEKCELTDLILDMMKEGGFGLVSYRPSEVAPSILEALDHWLLTRVTSLPELEVLEPFFSRCDSQADIVAQISALPLGQAYLCLKDGKKRLSNTSGIVTFRTDRRAIPHIRHLHKYLQAPLPKPKRFYFHDASGRYLERFAASLWEFREALNEVPAESLQYHLYRGDFERWLRNVLHDDQLAHYMQKTIHHKLKGEALRRALLKKVIGRYEELDNLA